VQESTGSVMTAQPMSFELHPDPARPLPPVMGLIAGEGDFPLLLAQGAHSAGVKLVVFGVAGLASDRLKDVAWKIYSLRLTDLSRLFELCREHDIKHLTMAGRVPHKVLLKQISLDPRVLKVLGRLGNKKADSILKAATEEIESEGIEVLDSTLFLKSTMPPPGLLTPGCPLDEETTREIDFGYPIAKEIARLDIGQTIAVKNQIVVGVEAIEGTDHLILRCGELVGPGVTFVKVSKPLQDMRFDVPVIGKTTIQNLIKIKARALAVTAGKTIFLDREESVELATRNGISLFGYQEPGYRKPGS
jgi:DUF1009 family protein